MLTSNIQIAIIGGGPGGLTLARLLHMRGASVKVYERDAGPEVRPQGATLDLHEDSGLKALQEAGLLEAFKKHYRPGADKMKITDENGNILFSDHENKQEEAFGQEHFRPEIDRGPLRDILVASLKEGSIQWDAQYQSMAKQGNKWSIRFKNGTTAEADLVIAADGANSKIRPLLSNTKPVYSGITVIEGNICNAAQNAPHLHKLLQGGKIFALGTQKSIILSAKGEGSLSFYTGTKETEDGFQQAGLDFNNKASIFAWFKQRFADWSPIWEELFASDNLSLIPRPMYHFPVDQHWEPREDLTMLGDAAHRMPPYAGEGINMAMLDALELAECLTNGKHPNILQAITAFEQQMQKRAGHITALTLEQTEALHAPDAAHYLTRFFNQVP